MRELFLSGRIKKYTNLHGDKEQKNNLKNKRVIDASPLSCFLEMMYDPKGPLSVFFMAELDIKYKVINQKQEDIEVLKKYLVEREKEISDENLMKTHFQETPVFTLMNITIALALTSLMLKSFLLRNHNVLILEKHHQNAFPFSSDPLPQFHLTLE
ncbi:unnamed protein product [Lactuca saligna]|uniref:Uncharacterized protein n=1 Tax=Lactuca saligna TaxID=75948 RepID=A0AA35ZA83_LACSI|nr:unnamed protein product [Lactuca saligna]